MRLSILNTPAPVMGRLEEPAGLGWMRTAVWTPADPAALLGTIVLLHGRSEFIEKYTETAGEWTARGWRVVSADWRGQGLSSRFVANRHKGHVPDFEIFLDDLDRILDALVPNDGRPVVAFAHSMGGHVLLRHAAERSRRFTALVLSAPMLGIRTGPIPRPVARWLARTAVRLGWGEVYAPAQDDYEEESQRFAGNPLTTDPVRFRVFIDAYRDNPELILGGVTFGWLDAAFRSMDRLFQHGELEKIATPVLLLSSTGDRVVRPDCHLEAARRLPRCRLVPIEGAEHELMMERDAIRARVWTEIDRFLAEVEVTRRRPPAAD